MNEDAKALIAIPVTIAACFYLGALLYYLFA